MTTIELRWHAAIGLVWGTAVQPIGAKIGSGGDRAREARENRLKRSLLYQLGQRDTGGLDRLIEEVSLAEQLAFESIWCLPEAGEAGDFRLGTPEFWVAALAAKTHRIRLGWGLAGLTPPSLPPIRSAEQAASLDLACGGRLELALLPDPPTPVEGDPSTWTEASAPWDEGIRMLVDMWDRPTFSWTSKRFAVPPVDVLPKPAQKPHPPLWLVGWSTDHARRAGRGGLGFVDVSGGDDEILEMHRDAYVSARSESDPHELVCASAYAASLGLDSDAKIVERLRSWNSLGFDQAILRIDPIEEDAQATRARIQILADESAEIH